MPKMGRKKLKMELIQNKKKLMRTFTIRKQGIIKKASELSKLCDVETAVVIFGPNGDEPAHVWPKEPEKLNSIINKYQNTSLDNRRKRAMNLSSLMDHKSKKSAPTQEEDYINNEDNDDDDDQVDNLMVKNPPTLDDYISGFSVEQLVELLNGLDAKLGLVESRIDMIKRGNLGDQEQRNMMMMNMEHMGNLNMPMQTKLECGYDHMYHEDQKMNTELMMRMINSDGGFNPTNVNVGDYDTGLIGMEGLQNHVLENVVNGGMVDMTSLTCYNDPFTSFSFYPMLL